MRNMKNIRICFIAAVCMTAALFLYGCGIKVEDHDKEADIDYTVVADEDLPEELSGMIEEKKGSEFKLTYATEDYLYIVQGYGKQETGGYSIAVKDLYSSTDAIYFSTELIGPEKGEEVNEEASYPYIVVKMEYMDQSVIYE